MNDIQSVQLEEWLHASDEEREDLHRKWAVLNGDGKEIVEEIANLFKDECVYDINEVRTSHRNGEWTIEAFVDPDDYENLKNRQDIRFLGFKIVFKN